MNRKIKCCFENSIFLKQLRNLKRFYLSIEEKISFTYLDSLTRRLTRETIKVIELGFRYSRLGQLTEQKRSESANLFQESRAINVYSKWIRGLKSRIGGLFAASDFVSMTGLITQDSSLKPLSVGCLIAAVAIAVNMFFLIILQKEVAFWGWLMRGLLLFSAIAGSFCKADWPTVKKGSVFLREM